jgi:hypothetical protein
MKAGRILACFWMLAALTAGAFAQAPPSPREAIEFFEKRVRPLLTDNCHSCHGPQRQKAGLRLDSREAFLKGSSSGAVVQPGHPDTSALVRAVRYDGDIKMPPKGRLPAEAVETLTAWVRMGAAWPEAPATPVPGADATAKARLKHWAFRPVRKPPVPAVWDTTWTQTPVDHFILNKLEEEGMRPSRPADRRTLLRRATFDLTGLPPTPEQVAAFEADLSPDAFARVVDRLLASPAYGERWGRHWLDVARYADTKGYVFMEERRFPFAYTYRDYVIRAFNEDLAFDQFILQQVAADRLPLGDDRRPLAALGFLTVGRRFLNNQHDIIDDRIDVVCRGFMGLTVTCARCHDHKFDPIPTQDYYSLYGVFASAQEPKELPLLGPPEPTPAYQAYVKELKKREQAVSEFLRATHGELSIHFRTRVADYLLAACGQARLPGEDHNQFVAPRDLKPLMVRRWQDFLAKTREAHDPVFAPWHAFAALPPQDFAAKAAGVAAQVAANGDANRRYNPLVAAAFAGPPPTALRDVAQRYGVLLAVADRLWRDALQKAHDEKTSPPPALAEPALEALRQVCYAPGAPANVPPEQVGRYVDLATRDRLTALRRQVDQWQANSRGAPPRAMVLEDAPVPVAARVLVRGNPDTPGPEVPRQFLQVVAGDQRQPFHQGSGRLELAQAIASSDNPLTARVMVNRLWQHHFGKGLVRTPSDFGLRGEPPTHPRLLDYLAATFMENDWSIKQMHRLIMLSRVYQQMSDDNPAYQQRDPDNRLLWKMNRLRLDFEELRDSLLAISGRLDPAREGRPVDLTAAPFAARRSVYGLIDRQNLPGLFRTFDFATPDATAPQRYTTTVPQQALFLMNSPFVVEQTRRLVGRPEVAALTEPEQRIDYLYRLLYGRAPDSEETALGLRFVHAHECEPKEPKADQPLGAWEKYAQVLLLANEFAYVD